MLTQKAWDDCFISLPAARGEHVGIGLKCALRGGRNATRDELYKNELKLTRFPESQTGYGGIIPMYRPQVVFCLVAGPLMGITDLRTGKDGIH